MDHNMQNILCLAPFISFKIDTNKGIRPCSSWMGEYFGNIENDELLQILTSDKWNELKKEMLQNKWPTGCVGCKAEELLSGESLRKEFARNYKKYSDDEVPRLLEIEVDSSNQCNFACIHCSSDYSDKWGKYEKILQEEGFRGLRTRSEPSVFRINETLLIDRLKQIDLSVIKLIRFKGGEPFLNKEIKKFIEFLHEERLLHQIDIHLVSNASVINTEFIQLLSEAKSITIAISLDGPEGLQQYIRYGAPELAKIERFILACSKLPNLRIDFLVSIMVYNIFSLSDIAIWWRMIRSKFPDLKISDPWFSHFVIFPKYLSIRVLPDECRQNLIAFYEQEKDVDYTSVIQMLKQAWAGGYWLNRLLSFTRIQEKHRVNSIVSIIPQLEPYMKESVVDRSQLAKNLIQELSFMIDNECGTAQMYLQRGILKREIGETGAQEDIKRAAMLDMTLFTAIPDYWYSE